MPILNQLGEKIDNLSSNSSFAQILKILRGARLDLYPKSKIDDGKYKNLDHM